MKRCTTHGVRLRNGDYCPVCGKETLTIPLWPFKVYIPKWFFAWPAIAYLAVAFILPAFRSCDCRSPGDVARDEFAIKWNHLPEEWRKIYYAVDHVCNNGDCLQIRITMLKTLLQDVGSNPQVSLTPLTDKDFELMANLFWGDSAKIQEGLLLLKPYILAPKK